METPDECRCIENHEFHKKRGLDCGCVCHATPPDGGLIEKMVNQIKDNTRLMSSIKVISNKDSKGWVDEFDKLFPFADSGRKCCIEPTEWHETTFKTFISQALSKCRNETLLKVMEMVKTNKNAYMFPTTEKRFIKDLSILISGK